MSRGTKSDALRPQPDGRAMVNFGTNPCLECDINPGIALIEGRVVGEEPAAIDSETTQAGITFARPWGDVDVYRIAADMMEIVWLVADDGGKRCSITPISSTRHDARHRFEP